MKNQTHSTGTELEVKPQRKPYAKPLIEKINLVPNEAVLGSICKDLITTSCWLDVIGGQPANLIS